VRFPFRRYGVDPTPALPSGAIYRPVIPIRLGPVDGPRQPFYGLLDTGADDVALPLSEAERLGVTLDRAPPIPYRGVGGLTFGYFGRVTIELRQSPKSLIWTTQAAFMPRPGDASPEEKSIIYLGHTGFFRFFHAHFDFQRLQVDVWPNGLFVGLPR
jgi:Aspartyl protease